MQTAWVYMRRISSRYKLFDTQTTFSSILSDIEAHWKLADNNLFGRIRGWRKVMSYGCMLCLFDILPVFCSRAITPPQEGHTRVSGGQGSCQTTRRGDKSWPCSRWHLTASWCSPSATLWQPGSRASSPGMIFTIKRTLSLTLRKSLWQGTYCKSISRAPDKVHAFSSPYWK